MGLISRVSSRTYRYIMQALEQERIEKQERLKRFYDRVNKDDETKNDNTLEDLEATPASADFKPEKALKFRNYKPHDSILKPMKMENHKPEKIGNQIRDQLIENIKEDEEDLGIDTLQPRKPDWDLKRDLNPKMMKLNRATHAALSEILRERLETAKKKPEPEPEPTDKPTPTEERVQPDRYSNMLPPQ